MSEAYYHEDDYCQIELVPSENEAFVESEIRAIAGFSEEHKAPGGVGWTEMYMRGDPKVQLRDKGITVNDFEKHVIAEIPKFDDVYTGYSTYRERCKNTSAYGNDSVKIFVSHQDGTIHAIWFDYHLTSVEVAETLYCYLVLLTKHFDLLFVDWAWGFYSRPITDSGLRDRLVGIATEIMVQNNQQKNEKTATTKRWWEFWK